MLKTIIFIILTTTAFLANSIEVESRGYAPIIAGDFQLAKFNATRNALRNASENANIELFSFTQYKNASISNDVVIGRSTAFVESFDIISTAEHKGKLRVDLQVRLTNKPTSKCIGNFNYRFAIAPTESNVALSVAQMKIATNTSASITNTIPYASTTEYNKNFISYQKSKPINSIAKKNLQKQGFQYLIIPTIEQKQADNKLTLRLEAFDVLSNEIVDSFVTDNKPEIEKSLFGNEVVSDINSRVDGWLSSLSNLPCKTPQGVLTKLHGANGTYEVSLGTEHNLHVGDKIAFFNEPQSISKYQQAIASGTVKSVFKNKAYVDVIAKHEPLTKNTIAAPLSPSFFNL